MQNGTQVVHCLIAKLHFIFIKNINYAWFYHVVVGISWEVKWAAAWLKHQNDLCVQQRLRSAQSDKSLQCVLNGWLRTQGFFIRTAKTLIRLGGCKGWSESSLDTHAIWLVLSYDLFMTHFLLQILLLCRHMWFCWFCQMILYDSYSYINSVTSVDKKPRPRNH